MGKLATSEFNPGPLVDISESNVWALIIEWPTGIRYTNQVGGYACLHPELEGFLVPLRAGVENRAVDAIGGHFYGNGSKYRGWCNEGIDEATADFLDKQLGTWHPLESIRVDRSRLKDCREAWIWVEGVLPRETLGEAKARIRGVLTWENSD